MSLRFHAAGAAADRNLEREGKHMLWPAEQMDEWIQNGSVSDGEAVSFSQISSARDKWRDTAHIRNVFDGGWAQTSLSLLTFIWFPRGGVV